MTLRITHVFDDKDKDELDIIINTDRGTAQIIQRDRQGTVTADRVRQISEVVTYLHNALRKASYGS